MSPLALPAPLPAGTPPFRDAAGAYAWLARQPQLQPLQMQAALAAASAAVDAADLPLAGKLEILDVLRRAAISVQSALEARYARKPLPPAPADAEVFAAAQSLWRALALAYLRPAMQLPPAAALVFLHRGAVALRLEQYSHFLATVEVPAGLLQLLCGVLAVAEALGVQQAPLVDPLCPHQGESHIAGQVAWALLLQLSDPYRLSLAQLAVANRALGRWRELAAFRAAPEADPKGRTVPLAVILGRAEDLPAGSRWLDVRPVVRKIGKRIAALEAGESPESLNLGRDLPADACVRLLRLLEEALRPTQPPVAGAVGGKLVFGPENAYLLFTGRPLQPTAMDAMSRSLRHQRMAVFGFDTLPGHTAGTAHPEVPGEVWQAAGGRIARPREAGASHLAPCLVAMAGQDRTAPRLGVLAGLRLDPDCLQGVLQWYSPPVEASWFQMPGHARKPRLPLFLLDGADGLSVVLPAGLALRSGEELALEDPAVARLLLGELRERGSDFVRYAARLLPQGKIPN